MPELPEPLECWLQTLPEFVQEVVRKRPPTTCYRSTEDDGHYWIEGVTELDGDVTYTLLHGENSFLPGFRVYHINPENLYACFCGHWKHPAEEQIESARKVTEAILKVATRPSPDGS